MHVGPLGSVIHVLRADAQTIERLAAIDWNRHFRRVCLDPVRGLITLMSPSRLHEDLGRIFDDIVDEAADRLGQASKPLGSTRLRGRGEPPGTGMEPDCTFYVGERADGYQAALMEGEAAADAFLESTAPDLVVEVELTNADAGKAERYGQMGVGELWRLHGRKGSRELRADFLPSGPKALRGRSMHRGCWRASPPPTSARRWRVSDPAAPGRAHRGGRTHRPPARRGAGQRGRGAVRPERRSAFDGGKRGVSESPGTGCPARKNSRRGARSA